MIETSYFPIFPTNVLGFRVDSCEELNKEISTYILKQKEVESCNDDRSVIGGWHSKNNLIELEYSWSKDLRDLIMAVVDDYINKLDTYIKQSGGVTLKERINGVKLESWGIVLNSGNISSYHTHPGSFLSGVYYVKVPQEMQSNSTGKFNIPDFRSGPMATMDWFSENFKFIPAEGMGLVFPSWIPHYVDPHFEDEERISISWNVQFDFKALNN